MKKKEKVPPKEVSHKESILSLVEEKERQLAEMLTETKNRTQREIELARQEASQYIEKVKGELPGLARQRLEAGLEAIEKEVQAIKRNSQLELQALTQEAEKHLKEAKERAIKVYLP
ncbi:MAG: hypothetical protein ACK4WF_04260 [Candidatus Brocadiales bacterium]